MTTDQDTDPADSAFLDRISTEFRELLGHEWPNLKALMDSDPKNRTDLDCKLKLDRSQKIPACGITMSYGPKKTKVGVPVFGEDPDQGKLGV